MLVIDASVILGWCFKDEASPAVDRVIDRVRDEGAWVPSLWRLEVANVLLNAERRGRIVQAERARRLELLADLPIETDDETDLRAWSDTLALAKAERLTVYDAAYLELALRRGKPLATLDRELGKAARKRGVPVAP